MAALNMSDATLPTKVSIANFTSSYEILTTLASYISSLDLYHLALTDRTQHYHILASPTLFSTLRRQSLCDGRGLGKRQSFEPLYSSHPNRWDPTAADEEIEVCLYNINCQEADALPCVKCGINICEECRFYPRAEPSVDGPSRRPHLSLEDDHGDIMCLCDECDAHLERENKGKFLNELCDCDLYKRWICIKCYQNIEKFSFDYFQNHTQMEEEIPFRRNQGPPTKTIEEDWGGCVMKNRLFWCVCGSFVRQETQNRCTWCSRRLPSFAVESEGTWTYAEYMKRLPYFDDNPDYPRWVVDSSMERYPKPYPRLGYWRSGDDPQPPQYRKLLIDPDQFTGGFLFD
ncbi:hypothetical protein CI238_11185 [Colletotrichum incanum]|uniref:Uncharacterized protein n=1 Tax=Colletotrichum incanum TaxID=1573173 RepID=A0A167EG25_COLIC|nr:hypothetical protein CI238_11185 [Colletotrichum incanum]